MRLSKRLSQSASWPPKAFSVSRSYPVVEALARARFDQSSRTRRLDQRGDRSGSYLVDQDHLADSVFVVDSLDDCEAVALVALGLDEVPDHDGSPDCLVIKMDFF